MILAHIDNVKMTDYVECEWFASCHNPSEATVDHPKLGKFEICKDHYEWLTKDHSPTKLFPQVKDDYCPFCQINHDDSISCEAAAIEWRGLVDD